MDEELKKMTIARIIMIVALVIVALSFGVVFESKVKQKITEEIGGGSIDFTRKGESKSIIVRCNLGFPECAYLSEIYDEFITRKKDSFVIYSTELGPLDLLLNKLEVTEIKRLFADGVIGDKTSRIPLLIRDEEDPSNIASEIEEAWSQTLESLSSGRGTIENLKIAKLYSFYQIDYAADIIPADEPETVSEGRTACEICLEDAGDFFKKCYAKTEPVNDDEIQPGDEPFYDNGSLWDLDLINMPLAWLITRGEKDIKVAVVEGGAKCDHEDLAENIVSCGDKVSGHGTKVTSKLGAAFNRKGIIGSAPNISMSIFDNYSIVDAAIDNVHAMNTSFAYEGAKPHICDTVDYAYALGIPVIASSGNDGQNLLIQAPAQCERAIVVGATTEDDTWASFSNYGINLDVVAPGQGVAAASYTESEDGTKVDTYETHVSGTSFSAPTVTGLVALMISEYPDLTIEQIRQILRKTADKSHGNFHPQYGYGRVDAHAALNRNYACECLLTSPKVNYYDKNGTVFVNGESYENAWTIAHAQTVDDNILKIEGIANCPQGRSMQEYILEYGEGDNPNSWTHIKTSDDEVKNEALGFLDMNYISQKSGLFTIRLRVTDSDGDEYEDRMQMNIANALITNFSPIMAKDTAPSLITVKGFARGDDFLKYYFEYAESLDGPWTGFTTNFTSPVDPLEDSRNKILVEGLNIGDMEVPEESSVFIRLVVEDSKVGNSYDIIKFSTDPAEITAEILADFESAIEYESLDASGSEICDNEIDDDDDGKVDCTDSKCFSKPYCAEEAQREMEKQVLGEDEVEDGGGCAIKANSSKRKAQN